MKIQDLMELIEPQVRSYDMSKRSMRDRSNTGNDAGEGVFSTVKQDRDPHLVKKTSKYAEDTHKDGYWFFIKNVIDHKLWENPYFPRVYQFKKFSKGDDAHYRVQLEKLVDLNSISKKELYAMARKVFGESGMKDVIEKEEDIIQIPAALEHLCENLYDGEIHTEGLDPDLVSAIATLRKMNANKFEYDLHRENIMARRGPHGLHMVIVDPFSVKR